MIKDIAPQLIPYGRIKAGRLGGTRKSKAEKDYRLPEKLDHLIITGMEKGADGNFIPNEKLMEHLKKSPDAQVDQKGNLIGIPISFLYNDPALNLFSRYAMYTGKKCVCSGDGETATRDNKSISCPCPNVEPDGKGARKCKPAGKLTCVIRGVPQVGGCYVFRTTSFNSIS